MPAVHVTNGEIHYEENGSGELIVLIAGLGHGAAYFEKALPALGKIGRAVAVDTRGVGRSTSKREEFSIESWAQDVADLVHRLGAKRAHLVGSSLGSCISLRTALDYPECVASLTVVAGFSELDRSLELNSRLRIEIIGSSASATRWPPTSRCGRWGAISSIRPRGRKRWTACLPPCAATRPSA